MSEHEFTGEPESAKGGDPTDQPGPGEPVGETLPDESEPTGRAELRKPDVGFHDDAGDES